MLLGPTHHLSPHLKGNVQEGFVKEGTYLWVTIWIVAAKVIANTKHKLMRHARNNDETRKHKSPFDEITVPVRRAKETRDRRATTKVGKGKVSISANPISAGRCFSSRRPQLWWLLAHTRQVDNPLIIKMAKGYQVSLEVADRPAVDEGLRC